MRIAFDIASENIAESFAQFAQILPYFAESNEIVVFLPECDADERRCWQNVEGIILMAQADESAAQADVMFSLPASLPLLHNMVDEGERMSGVYQSASDIQHHTEGILRILQRPALRKYLKSFELFSMLRNVGVKQKMQLLGKIITGKRDTINTQRYNPLTEIEAGLDETSKNAMYIKAQVKDAAQTVRVKDTVRLAMQQEEAHAKREKREEPSFAQIVTWMKHKVHRRIFGAHRQGVDMHDYIALMERIKTNKQKGIKSICILAPIFTPERLQDGYYKRIKAIDDILGERYDKIYLSAFAADGAMMQIDFVDALHVNIACHFANRKQRNLAIKIARACGKVYMHSVLQWQNEIMTDPQLEKTWDVHGSVPEEYMLSGDLIHMEISNERERLAMKHVDNIIVVSKSMAEYLHTKHPGNSKEMIVMPIFEKEIRIRASDLLPRNMVNGCPVVVYAGGLQPWQRIGFMQDVMAAQKSTCAYRIFVPDPPKFMETWGDRPLPDDLVIDSKSYEDLVIEYDASHYGFLLREDIVVNRVACPTKLIEYIQHGIVPILDTPHVGDFERFGMHYVRVEDFVNNVRPTEEQRQQYAIENLAMLDKLTDQFAQGKAALMRVFGLM